MELDNIILSAIYEIAKKHFPQHSQQIAADAYLENFAPEHIATSIAEVLIKNGYKIVKPDNAKRS